jgi:hypothetical protein
MPDARQRFCASFRMSAKYLFVTEGGERVFAVDDEFTPHDAACVRAGILSIVRLVDMHEMSAEGAWHPVDKGRLVSPPDDLTDLGPYHDSVPVVG